MTTSPTPHFGLFCIPRGESERSPEPVPVPLAGVRVRALVRGTACRVTVVQRYVNREETPIEAVHVFPLEQGSAVCGFAVTVDGRRLEGRVLEREAAFDAYDEALSLGHGAYLLDQERPDVFTSSVGNVPPGATVEVEVSYVCELEWERAAVRLRIPATVATAYENVRPATDVDRVRKLFEEKKITAVTFTSSSTVHNFVEMLGQKGYIKLMGGVAVACIGPVTAKTAEEYGMKVDIMPKDYTIPALVEAMVEYYKKRT